MECNKIDLESIGERIRNLREEKNLTQSDLAKILNVKRETIAQWEAGTRDLKTGYIIALANYFNISCDELLRNIKPQNINVSKELGLTDKAIEAFSRINELFPFELDSIIYLLENFLDCLDDPEDIFFPNNVGLCNYAHNSILVKLSNYLRVIQHDKEYKPTYYISEDGHFVNAREAEAGETYRQYSEWGSDISKLGGIISVQHIDEQKLVDRLLLDELEETLKENKKKYHDFLIALHKIEFPF